MSLTSEQFDQWVTLLRDPETKQAKYTLKNEEGAYCCLGVLCEKVLGATVPLGEAHNEQYQLIEDALGDSDVTTPLMRLNDSVVATPFPEIADYLEEHRDEYVA